MSSDAFTLRDYPSDTVEFACTKCERGGRYRKASLIAIHGAEIGLPDLRMMLAADCPRMRRPTGNDLCGIRYSNLIADIP